MNSSAAKIVQTPHQWEALAREGWKYRVGRNARTEWLIRRPIKGRWFHFACSLKCRCKCGIRGICENAETTPCYCFDDRRMTWWWKCVFRYSRILSAAGCCSGSFKSNCSHTWHCAPTHRSMPICPAWFLLTNSPFVANFEDATSSSDATWSLAVVFQLEFWTVFPRARCVAFSKYASVHERY